MQDQAGTGLAQESVADLFALSDEQILEIEPEPRAGLVAAARQLAREQSATAQSFGEPSERQATAHQAAAESAARTNPLEENAASPKPGPFATPEDVRVLGEIYPGGLTQAKTAAERARTLDEIDAAYFGAGGNSFEQVSASRAQLAQRLLREDPAAFREMVFAGLRALEASGNTPVVPTLGSPALSAGAGAIGGASSTPAASVQHGQAAQASQPAPSRAELEQHAHLAAYGAFEKAANADLEKSVGSAIERALHQVLPHSERAESATLNARLSATIRTDIEKALQGDRQLGEQVAQVLSSRRFDNEARTQVVRLINDRAQQLVPGVARRALNDWTHATLAAHRAKTRSADAGATRADVTPASGQGIAPAAVAAHIVPTAREQKTRGTSSRAGQNSNTHGSSRVDYRRLSDEQILDL